jgi:hypothetical protein
MFFGGAMAGSEGMDGERSTRWGTEGIFMKIVYEKE